MATQPTQNPVPSESPRDLKFNAGKIDEFVTSDAHEYIDRLGGLHRTIEGINYDANQAMLKYGYITKDSFEDGSTISFANECLRWKENGEFYRWDGPLPKVVPAGSTPDSAGGIGKNAWVGVGDASLRSDLNKNTGAGLIRVASGNTVQQEIDLLKLGYKTPEDFGAKGNGSVDDTLAITQALLYCANNNVPLRIPAKQYLWKGGDISHDNISVIGDRRPYADAGLTRLIGGSVIIGTFKFTGKNPQVRNIGVDHGSFRFPDIAGDALIMSSPNKSGEYAVIDNCVGLGRNPTDAYHSILCEGYRRSKVTNVIGIQNTYSLAQKSARTITDNVHSINSSTGIIVKSDATFGDASFSSIDNIVIDGNGNCNIGLWAYALGAQLQKLNINNITSSGCKYDLVVQADGGVINELNISNLAGSASSVASLAVVATAADAIYTVNISNVAIGEANGFLLDIQAGNIVNISNVSGRITSSSTKVNNSINIGSLVGVCNLSNVVPTINYSMTTPAGITFLNSFDKNSVANVRAGLFGAGAPKPGYFTQAASGASGVVSARYSDTNSSFSKISLPSGNAEISTLNQTFTNGAPIPPGYTFFVQNTTAGATLTITPSANGHIVTTGNTPKVLSGGDKVGFLFDGNSWIQI